MVMQKKESESRGGGGGGAVLPVLSSPTTTRSSIKPNEPITPKVSVLVQGRFGELLRASPPTFQEHSVQDVGCGARDEKECKRAQQANNNNNNNNVGRGGQRGRESKP